MTQLAVAYLLNAAWIAPLLGLSALALERCGGLAPARRSQIWTAALVCAALLPVVPAWGVQLGAAVDAEFWGAGFESGAGGRPGWSANLPLGIWMRGVLVVGSAAVVMVGLLRLGVALFAVRRLVRSSEPLDLTPDAARALAEFTAEHGCAAVEVRRTCEVSSPAVVGWRRPILLAPPEIDRLDAAQLRSTLLHEAAHVVRGDYRANLLVEFASIVVAWHPVLHGMRARLRTAREAACDALAATASPSRRAYANGLVGAARVFAERRPAGGLSGVAALGLTGRGDLEARIADLLSAKAPGARASGLRASFAAALAVMVVAGPVLLFRVTPESPVVRLAMRAPPLVSRGPPDVETAKLGARAAVRRRPREHAAAPRRVLLARTERRQLISRTYAVLTAPPSLAPSANTALLRAHIDTAVGASPPLRSAILWIDRAKPLPQPDEGGATDAGQLAPTDVGGRPRPQSEGSPTSPSQNVQVAEPVAPAPSAKQPPAPQPLPSIT